MPVTRGARLCAFFWSRAWCATMPSARQLHSLDQTIQALRARLGEAPECVALTAHYHNLLRMWAEV